MQRYHRDVSGVSGRGTSVRGRVSAWAIWRRFQSIRNGNEPPHQIIPDIWNVLEVVVIVKGLRDTYFIVGQFYCFVAIHLKMDRGAIFLTPSRNNVPRSNISSHNVWVRAGTYAQYSQRS